MPKTIIWLTLTVFGLFVAILGFRQGRKNPTGENEFTWALVGLLVFVIGILGFILQKMQ